MATSGKISGPMENGKRVLGDRWSSTVTGEHIWFISLNSINQPKFLSSHETPLLGGVVAKFDIKQCRWNKSVIFDALSYEANLEGKCFGFRHTLLLLTYRKYSGFSYQRLYYWKESDGENGKGQWVQNSLYIDPKTEIKTKSNIYSELIVTDNSADYITMIIHDRSEGAVMVSQLDTVGGYGKPGPARIDFLINVQYIGLKGEGALVISAVLIHRHLWILFFGNNDPTGSPVRLLSVNMKNNSTEEVDLSATVHIGSPIIKPNFTNAVQNAYSNSMHLRCRFCQQQGYKGMNFTNGLCGSQWIFIIDQKELWSIDLREGRWRILAKPKSSTDNKKGKEEFEKIIHIPSDVDVYVWNDADLQFYGISLDTGVYVIDPKGVLDEF